MALQKFFSNIFAFPSIRADDEELVDPQAVLRENCGKLPKISVLQDKYQACNDRVNSKKNTAENCTEELYDFLGELDSCVSKTLFSKLK